MGVAFYLSLETELDGTDAASVDGKAMARAEAELDRIAEQAGVPTLLSFFSASAEELAGVEDIADLEVPPIRWFAPEEGLRVVDALLNGARDQPKLAHAMADLTAMRVVLRAAADAGVRFHLSIDI
jgi:hypothetical protein